MLPWNSEALREWSIVGMNHYLMGGERRLYVAMVKDGRCIKAEGADEGAVFETLEVQAQGGPSEMSPGASPGAMSAEQMQQIVDDVRAAHGDACVCLLCGAVKMAMRAELDALGTGNISSCASCGHAIVWKGEYWKHVDATYRHPARPVEKPNGAR